MKAVVIHAAKDLRIEEREAEQPGPGQVEVEFGEQGFVLSLGDEAKTECENEE